MVNRCNGNRHRAGLSVAIFFALVLAPGPTAAQTPQASRQDFLDHYCTSCHNQKSKTAGLVLENSRAVQPDSDPVVWEKVIRRLNAGEMPPAGMPRPDESSL